VTTTAPSTSVTQPWGVGDALIGICAGFAGSIVLGTILGVTTHPSLVQQFVLNLPLWAAFLAVPIWATRSRGAGPKIDLHLSIRPIDALALVVGGLVQVVVGWAYLPFVSNKDLEKPAQTLAHSAHGTPGKVLLTVMTCLIAPMLEEFFYRGLILQSVRRRLPDWSAILVVALVFAAMHFEALQLPGLFVFGAVAGTLCVKADRLGPAVLAHIGFNAVALWQLHII
jgi:membrane protease YdiL (CAAX protease family)